MSVQSYHVMGAMLALREFTTGDLVAHSRVDEGVVNAFLRQNRELFALIDTVPSRRPHDDQFRRMALNREKVEEVRRRLDELYSSMRRANVVMHETDAPVETKRKPAVPPDL